MALKPTERPPFDPEEFARASEDHLVALDPPEATTVPPEPFYEELRDSCSLKAVAVAHPDEPMPDSTDWQSDVRVARAASPAESLPSLQAIPKLAVSRADLPWFELGANAAAVVYAINEKDTVEEIAAACGIPAADAQRLLVALAADGVVEFL